MPWLSGIDLLSKIMSHKSRKNIPVISEYISNTIFYYVKETQYYPLYF